MLTYRVSSLTRLRPSLQPPTPRRSQTERARIGGETDAVGSSTDGGLFAARLYLLRWIGVDVRGARRGLARPGGAAGQPTLIGEARAGLPRRTPATTLMPGSRRPGTVDRSESDAVSWCARHPRQLCRIDPPATRPPRPRITAASTSRRAVFRRRRHGEG
jgi:hypothetical protein